jgi:hypothetical protein
MPHGSAKSRVGLPFLLAPAVHLDLLQRRNTDNNVSFILIVLIHISRLSNPMPHKLSTILGAQLGSEIPYFLGTRTEGERGKYHYGENHCDENPPVTKGIEPNAYC